MEHWIDAHSHLQDPSFINPISHLLQEAHQHGVIHHVVNATSQTDWQSVASLHLRFPEFITPAFGIHPWYAHQATPDAITELHHLLLRFPTASIGECGLDRAHSPTHLNAQREQFEAQLHLSVILNRPVTIHSVKATGLCLEILTQIQPPRGFLMHSFHGSTETIRKLLDLGAYFSFSRYFTQSLHAEKSNLFTLIPPHRILVETDAPNFSPEHHPYHSPKNLPDIAKHLTSILKISLSDLSRLTVQNTKNLFLNATIPPMLSPTD